MQFMTQHSTRLSSDCDDASMWSLHLGTKCFSLCCCWTTTTWDWSFEGAFPSNSSTGVVSAGKNQDGVVGLVNTLGCQFQVEQLKDKLAEVEAWTRETLKQTNLDVLVHLNEFEKCYISVIVTETARFVLCRPIVLFSWHWCLVDLEFSLWSRRICFQMWGAACFSECGCGTWTTREWNFERASLAGVGMHQCGVVVASLLYRCLEIKVLASCQVQQLKDKLAEMQAPFGMALMSCLCSPSRWCIRRN